MMDETEHELPLREGRFFLPGPTEVSPSVLEAQARPVISHRGSEMRSLMKDIQPGLQLILGTSRPVYLSTSSATGMMEAAIRNGVRSRVLALVNGAFSQRFVEIARSCAKEVEVLEVGWGEAHDADMVRERLTPGGFDAVTVVHSETSTGVLNPVEEISRVVHNFDDVHLLVDSVSGVGGAEIRADDWKLDFLLTGSQKALALPPGISFGVASARLLERSAELEGKGFYFDLLRFEDQLEKLQTPTTPAVSLMYALAEQIQRIQAEGLPERLGRHALMAARCWEWVTEMAARGLPLGVLAPAGRRSPTVTCVTLPEGLTGPDIVAEVAQEGFVIGAGYGKLKESSIRIGHMGDHTLEGLERLLEQLGAVLTARFSVVG